MPLDVYFSKDICQGIVAIAIAMLSASIANGGGNVEYCRGVIDTARAHGELYGLSWEQLSASVAQSLRDRSLLTEFLAGLLE